MSTSKGNSYKNSASNRSLSTSKNKYKRYSSSFISKFDYLNFLFINRPSKNNSSAGIEVLSLSSAGNNENNNNMIVQMLQPDNE